MSYGKYSTHLPDNQEIIYRKASTNTNPPGQWIISKVCDDRIYGPQAECSRGDEYYHVTATTTHSIDFGINSNGMNSGHREWEVFTPAMNDHPDYDSIDTIKSLPTTINTLSHFSQPPIQPNTSTAGTQMYRSPFQSPLKSSPIKNALFEEITKDNETTLIPKASLKQNMDTNNSKIIDIWRTQGTKAAIHNMFTHPETGKPLSYSEMRSFYG